MYLKDPESAFNAFKILLLEIAAETRRPVEHLDMSERNYKKNMNHISRIDVSEVYTRLSLIFERVNELKLYITATNSLPSHPFAYQPLLRQYCDDYQNLVHTAYSIDKLIQQRSGILGFLKGYNNPVETILNGRAYQLDYNQLRQNFAYQANVLSQTESHLMAVLSKDLDSFLSDLSN
ncbi:hypothetical protein KW432_13045 [Vibrio fluvialis]|nr:hypothetical protein [Vibrio fluvialis]